MDTFLEITGRACDAGSRECDVQHVGL